MQDTNKCRINMERRVFSAAHALLYEVAIILSYNKFITKMNSAYS
jgi:hypothetical protein